eukprot:TRINITY_DN279_c0_g1_i1.p1 TRINITY_DN279_c0_g1~~TRINITY_DN279_c0_g1_i1.p1  ORF type:complete len:373 (+),score=55.73 TRINITY_DN279_c0_g1_i1:95-1213(+)
MKYSYTLWVTNELLSSVNTVSDRVITLCCKLVSNYMCRNNPHIYQVYLNDYTLNENIPFSRQLKDDDPRTKYRRRNKETKTVIHWGQRKLLLSEIEFLSKYGTESKNVVYAGASPGTHIKVLSQMFPDHIFYLYDPAPFNKSIIEYSNKYNKVKLYQIMFTDELALEFENVDVLFISDIRSADSSIHNREEHELRIRIDLYNQLNWHNMMKSTRSMFKFRLPYGNGYTKYINGDIYLPVWGPITTSECRLVTNRCCHPTDNELINYDNCKYEEQMFYFNTIRRVGLYSHNVKGEGLDHCYDCRSEIEILKLYLETNELQSNEKAIAKLSKKISRFLGKRTLKDKNIDPEKRRKGIEQRQHIKGMPAYINDIQ